MKSRQPHPLQPYIAQVLDQIRVNKNISKAEIARRSGITDRAVRLFFNSNKTNITMSVFLHLCDALDISGEEVMRVALYNHSRFAHLQP